MKGQRMPNDANMTDHIKLHSKLERKFNTICLSLASDASEILPSALQTRTKLIKSTEISKQNKCVPVQNVPDGCQQVLVLAQDVLQEGLLELGDLAGLHFVQVAPHAGVDDSYLFFNGHWS